MTDKKCFISLSLLTALLFSTGCARKENQSTQDAGRKTTIPNDSESSYTPSTPSSTVQIGRPEDFDDILKKYVDGDYFDYNGLRNNAADMNKFEGFILWQAEADVSEMPTEEDKIAFYINAYNSCSIKAILDHYPLHTPNDVDGFFDKLTFKVAGEDLKLGGSDGDSMEYDRLIANYQDMRAHFAVVCADRGCLPLKPGAYNGENLNADLEAAAKKFIGDERHFKIDKEKKEVHISKIFEWYGEKFLKDPGRPVKNGKPELYLANWLDAESRKFLEAGDYTLKISLLTRICG